MKLFKKKKETPIETSEPDSPKKSFLARINPIEKIKEERIRKQKEKEERERKERQQLVIAVSGLLIVLLVWSLITSLNSKPKTGNTQKYDVPVINQSVPTAKEEENKEEEQANDFSELNNTGAEVTVSEVPMESEEVEESIAEENMATETMENPFHKLERFDWEGYTDYNHVSESATLGNDESLTLTIEAYGEGITMDDIVIVYEESELSVTTEIKEQTNNSLLIQCKVQGLKEGYYHMGVISSYELIEKREQATGYIIDIHQLNQQDGQIVYITYTGEKYHSSLNCVGDGAIKTTLYDARALGLEPCGKCY